MTATRLPLRSTSWRHSAEWKAGPAKLPMPSISGNRGRLSWPTAVTTAEASMVSVLPSLPLSNARQTALPSSQARVSTMVSKRIFFRRSYLSAMPRKYFSSSGWGEKCCGQAWLGSKE